MRPIDYIRKTHGFASQAPSSKALSSAPDIVDGMWAGQRCFIVGGGPTLKGFDWSRLKGELTIGINRAFEKFDPTIIFSMDTRFHDWLMQGKWGAEVKKRFLEYPGIRLWATKEPANIFDNGVQTIPCSLGGTSTFTASVRHGLFGQRNSGYAALNLAILLGCNPIYLLGFDMRGNGQGKQKWYHDGYPVVTGENVYRNFANSFRHAAPDAKKLSRIVLLTDSVLEDVFERQSIDDVPTIERPIYASYATKGEYEADLTRLRRSLVRLGLEHHLEVVPDSGSWAKNCAKKPEFLLSVLQANPGRSVVWVDADAQILRYPATLTGHQTGDLRVHYRDRGNGRTELLSGTVFVNGRSRVAAEALTAWAARCRKNPSVWDQRTLAEVLTEMPGVNVDPLPAEYCCIFDKMAAEAPEPVIEHYQASRRMRQKAG